MEHIPKRQHPWLLRNTTYDTQCEGQGRFSPGTVATHTLTITLRGNGIDSCGHKPHPPTNS